MSVQNNCRSQSRNLPRDVGSRSGSVPARWQTAAVWYYDYTKTYVVHGTGWCIRWRPTGRCFKQIRLEKLGDH